MSLWYLRSRQKPCGSISKMIVAFSYDRWCQSRVILEFMTNFFLLFIPLDWLSQLSFLFHQFFFSVQASVPFSLNFIEILYVGICMYVIKFQWYNLFLVAISHSFSPCSINSHSFFTNPCSITGTHFLRCCNIKGIRSISPWTWS